jgi:hypothetical protein
MFHWNPEEERVYIQECFSHSNFWHSQQDDTVMASLERLGLMGNVTIRNAVIMDGQTGARLAPPNFIGLRWAEYVARREALSFEIEKDPLPKEVGLVEQVIQESESESEPEPESCLEYIAASELFGY